jgi:hypothetical protein
MDVRDSRTVTDFQKFTFSGHLRTHVYKVLDENVKLGHADYACFWTLELLCSGLTHSFWNTIFLSAAVHINRAAPNVFLYLVRKYEEFNPIESGYSVLHMTDIRNHAEARQIVCEVAATVALCRKLKLPVFPKLKPEHDFTQLVIQENLKSTSNMFARSVIKQEDPLEFFIPVNELMYSLRPESRDVSRCLYWSSWILTYASKWKQDKKIYLDCAYRTNDYVEEKYLRSPIWILWACIHETAKNSPVHQYIDALYKLYCLRWAKGDLKKRLPFFVTAVLLLCEPVDMQYQVPQSISTVQDVVQNIPQWIQAIIHTNQSFHS